MSVDEPYHLTMLPHIDDRKRAEGALDRKSTRLNSSHTVISYAVFCLRKTDPWNLRLVHVGDACLLNLREVRVVAPDVSADRLYDAAILLRLSSDEDSSSCPIIISMQ